MGHLLRDTGYMEPRVKVVYLLGAGFSHAITSGKAPLTEELGECLKDTFTDDLRQKFNFNPNNIELFFTQLDLEILHLRQLEQDAGALERIRGEASHKIVDIFATKKLFCIENTGIKIPDSGNKICNMLFRKNDTILTVNYDCALENILFAQNKWSTRGGWRSFCFNQDTENRDKKLNIEIFKLHGSINFVLVATLNGNKFNYDNLQLEWFVDKELFPDCHESTDWQEEIKEYIVLPSYLKQFEYTKIVSLWREAVLRVQDADRLVIIGCGLREEDYLLRFLISLVSKTAKIIIIDPSVDEIKSRMIKTISVNANNIHPIKSEIQSVNDNIVNAIYDN